MPVEWDPKGTLFNIFMLFQAPGLGIMRNDQEKHLTLPGHVSG